MCDLNSFPEPPPPPAPPQGRYQCWPVLGFLRNRQVRVEISLNVKTPQFRSRQYFQKLRLFNFGARSNFLDQPFSVQLVQLLNEPMVLGLGWVQFHLILGDALKAYFKTILILLNFGVLKVFSPSSQKVFMMFT